MITNLAAFVQSPQRKAAFALYLALFTVLLNLSASAQPSFTTFDFSGAIGTSPSSINPQGAITGSYTDANFVMHGFLRAQAGTFTTFEAPGAFVTVPSGINPRGAITGFYQLVAGSTHGFLRTRDGTFTTFDAPDSSIQIFPISINSSGAITGYYLDARDRYQFHGFLRRS